MEREPKRPKTDSPTDMSSSGAPDVAIDDSLYSRQRYVLGDGAMQRLAKSNVLISGAGGLGIEVAKNVVLAGVRSCTIHDTKDTTVADLGTQFFLTPEDIGGNRAEASAARLAELNPYVRVESSVVATLCEEYITQFQCVVLTECTLEEQVRVDGICRAQTPPIQFICADVYGLFGTVFVDFGPEFQVVDATGEEPKSFLISQVTQEKAGVVTTIGMRMHNLEDGDKVQFAEVEGMSELNEGTHTVKVLSPYKFSISDTRSFEAYTRNGSACQVLRRKEMDFKSLQEQLRTPDLLITDYAKFDRPPQIWLAIRAMHQFFSTHSRYPEPQNEEDAQDIERFAEQISSDDFPSFEGSVDKDVLKMFSFTCGGSLAPLCATLGGWTAQEVLKGLTGKFTPLLQVLCLDAMEVGPRPSDLPASFLPRGDRYDLQRICLGDELCGTLAKLKLFMIGCGAIGCELLKNFALLGISAGADSAMVITDNDVIEKSNLNRQFLFRPQHIQQPKSVVAAASVLAINPGMQITAHQHKVGPATTETVYTDAFFGSRDIVVNALDNVQARLFVDSRCVACRRPLLESGTMGAKGHVQVIVPDLTESYGSQRDPPEADVPYCTIKSFPSTIEHTIQWARDKFANLFELKPAEFNKFWESNGSVDTVLEALRSRNCGRSYDSIQLVMKILSTYPTSWADCVALGRSKFEKYFNHKARNLLSAFPLDTKLQDGKPFWQSPKRPPQPLDFDAANEMHIAFIQSAARLFAIRYGVPLTKADLTQAGVGTALQHAKVPEYVPKTDAKVETDENVKKESVQKKAAASIEDYAVIADKIAAAAAQFQRITMVEAAIFEKDDDANGHIDFITAASNLRAATYGIAPADRLRTKLVAGKIVPAIATTTAAVSGLVALELIKIARGVELSDYKNAFLNLALPFMILTEPAEPAKEPLIDDRTWTLWDKWEVTGAGKETTLADFIASVKEKYGLTPVSVINGASIVYMSVMPAHQKRLTKSIKKLLKPSDTQTYAELTATFAEGENIVAPPIRYHFGKKAKSNSKLAA